MITSRRLFLFLCLSFLAGDIFGISSELFLFASVGGIWLFGLLFRRYTPSVLLSVFLSGMLGFLIGDFSMQKGQEEYRLLSVVTGNFQKKWEVRWTLEKLISVKERSSVYLLRIDTFDTLDIGSTWKPFSLIPYRQTLSTSIFVEVPSNLHISLHESISFVGKIRENIVFPLEGYERFSYFHWGYGYIFISTFQRNDNKKASFIEKLRADSITIFRTSFPDDVAGILLGMTVGITDLLSRDTKADFIGSGLTHILVVSGSNIAFLILLITFFLKYIHLSRWLRIGSILMFLLFYGTLVGWDVSVIRATIMGILSYSIASNGMRGSSRAILALALIVLITISPLSPLYDPGFGLSFWATLGIILFHTKIASLGRKCHMPEWSLPFFSITLWASLWSLPVMVYHFGNIPVMSIIANILIASLLGWILFSSVLFIGMHLIAPSLAYFLWFLIYIPTKYILWVGDVFGSGLIISVPPEFRSSFALLLLGIYGVLFLEDDGSGPSTTHQKDYWRR